MHRILIVDDSPVAAIQLEHCLAKSGYEDLTTASDAKEALEILAECHDKTQDDTDGSATQFDLILMDINMPDIDGIEATRIIKTDPCLRDIPVILVSASDEKTILEEGFNVGAIDYISKPVDLVELRARVAAAMRLKQEMDRRKARERELEVLKNKFEMLSNLDGLTGIPNRRRFDVAYAAEWMRARRDREHISLLMIDIDFFKNYNDYYGHVQGDACLRMVAKAVAGALQRPADLAARYGGEEFVAMLPNTDETGARRIAEHIQSLVEEMGIEHRASNISSNVTVTVGGACASPNLRLGPDILLEAADKALYTAKRAGRNRILVHPDHCACPSELAELPPISPPPPSDVVA